jgi:hypothetical protein
MRLALAYFADSAQWVGGKLYMLGGCITKLFGYPFPLTPSSLAAVLHFVAPPDEFGAVRRLTGVMERVGGDSLPLEIGFPLVPSASPEHPDRPNSYIFVLNFKNLQFPQPGEYILRLAIDDQEVGTLSLDLINTAPQ